MEAPIIIEQSYHVPTHDVWKALTDLAQMKQWYFPQLPSFEPRVGFETEFTVRHNDKDFIHLWKITDVVPEKKISYEWRYGGYPGRGLLEFSLKPEGNETRVRLDFSFLESFGPEENPDLSRANFLEGWTHFSGSLKDFLNK